MKLSIRNPGAPPQSWDEEIDWPDGWRIPCVGELICIDRGQFPVEAVQWFNEQQDGALYQDVQLIVRAYS